MTQPIDLSVALLHEGMVDKNGRHVTTSLTLIDIHDIARSARTYGSSQFFIAHPAETLRTLASTLKTHWDEGFGAQYNPNRKDALERVCILPSFDEVIETVKARTGQPPLLVATSANGGPSRTPYSTFSESLPSIARPVVLMFGTGWGMGPDLLARADVILEPIYGPTAYNHLSVRSAVAIILDKLLGASR